MQFTNTFSYAPVIIPTLSRYEHFKRCLESLERCSLAKETDVYVGLDYPPSDKYVDGWKKIDTYLSLKEESHNFKKFIVFRRERNCGVGHEFSNDGLLFRFIREHYENYIFTEDDNEFSPCFLEYMNWGLSNFKNDKSIYAICGFSRMELPFLSNNVYKLNTKYVAWGYGSWADRLDKFICMRNKSSLHKFLEKMSVYDMLFKDNKTASAVVTMLKENNYLGDCIVRTLPIEQRYCVYPKLSVVRNWGTDGSGVHGGNAKQIAIYTSMNIDENKHFSPICDGDLYDKRILDVWRKTYPSSMKIKVYRFLIVLRYLLYDKFIIKL